MQCIFLTFQKNHSIQNFLIYLYAKSIIFIRLNLKTDFIFFCKVHKKIYKFLYEIGVNTLSFQNSNNGK